MENFVDTIVLGDNRPMMAALPPDSVDLTVTSPPYFNAKTEYAAWSTYAAYLEDVGTWLTLLFRVTKPGRRVVWNVSNIATGQSLIPIPHDTVKLALAAGFWLREEFFWEDPASSGGPVGTFPNGPHVLMRASVEHMLVFQKPKTHVERHKPLPPELKPYNWMDKNFYRDRVSKQVWYISPVMKMDREGHNLLGHPAPFPEALVAPCIRMWSRPAELVFDPFMGSGTTALAALSWRRHFLGCEWVEEYHALGLKQIEVRRMQLLNEELAMSLFPEAHSMPTYEHEQLELEPEP